MAKVQKNLLLNLLLSLSQIVFPLFTIPYIARVLSPNSIGQVSFTDSFAFYFTILAEFGIMTYGVREVAQNKGDALKLKQTVSSLLSLHIITAFFAILLFSCFVILLWSHFEDPTILLLAYFFLFVNAFASEWYFYGQEAFRYIAIRSILVRLAGIMAIYWLVQTPDDYLWYYGIIVFSSTLTTGLNFYQIARKGLFRFNLKAGLKHVRYIWTINIVTILYAVPLMLDNVVLGIVASATMVGLYALTVKIVRISGSIVTDSIQVFFPSVVALQSRNAHEQAQQQLQFSIKLIILFAVPLCMGIFFLAGDIIPAFLGDKFATVIPDLQILAIYPLIKAVSLYYSNPILIANHKEKNYLKNLLASSILFFILAFAGGYYFQATGMCLALLTAETLLLVLNGVSVKKHFPGVPLFSVKAFTTALLTALLFYPVFYGVNLLGLTVIPALIIKVGGCVLFYLFVIFVLIKPFGNRKRPADGMFTG